MLSGEMNREINKLRKLGLVPNTFHDILEKSIFFFGLSHQNFWYESFSEWSYTQYEL